MLAIPKEIKEAILKALANEKSRTDKETSDYIKLSKAYEYIHKIPALSKTYNITD